MKYYIETYRGSVGVDLPEGVTEVSGVIISGDEILVYPVFCDPMYIHRIDDYFDGCFRKRWNGKEWESIDIPEIYIDIEEEV